MPIFNLLNNILELAIGKLSIVPSNAFQFILYLLIKSISKSTLSAIPQLIKQSYPFGKSENIYPPSLFEPNLILLYSFL